MSFFIDSEFVSSAGVSIVVEAIFDVIAFKATLMIGSKKHGVYWIRSLFLQTFVGKCPCDARTVNSVNET